MLMAAYHWPTVSVPVCFHHRPPRLRLVRYHRAAVRRWRIRYGYEVGGLCLLLKNYHNLDWHHMRLAAECIDVRDHENPIRFLIALLRQPPFDPRGRVRQDLARLFARQGHSLPWR